MVLASTLGDVASATATVVAALIGLYGAYLGSKKVRSETVSGEVMPDRPAGGAASGQAGLSPEVEGYIVRFIIFYLVLQVWVSFRNVTNPFIYLGGPLIDLATGVIYVAIFLLLGLPLLIDIARRYGIRGSRRPARPRP